MATKMIYAKEMQDVFGFTQSEFFCRLFKEWKVDRELYTFRGCTVRFGHWDEEKENIIITDDWDEPIVIIQKGDYEARLLAPTRFRAKARGNGNSASKSLTIGRRYYTATQLAKIFAASPETPGALRVTELHGFRLTGIFMNKRKERAHPADAHLLSVYFDPAPNPFRLELPESFRRWCQKNADRVQVCDEPKIGGRLWWEFFIDYEEELEDRWDEWDRKQKIDKKITELLDHFGGEKLETEDKSQYYLAKQRENYTAAAIEAARILFLAHGKEVSLEFASQLSEFIEQEYNEILLDK